MVEHSIGIDAILGSRAGVAVFDAVNQQCQLLFRHTLGLEWKHVLECEVFIAGLSNLFPKGFERRIVIVVPDGITGNLIQSSNKMVKLVDIFLSIGTELINPINAG